MSKLELIIGPMFSGKSTELVRRVRALQQLEKNVLVIKPSIDNRYEKGTSELITHNNDSIKCNVMERLSDLDEFVIKIVDTIVIDEGQFFSDLKETVLFWLANYKVNIIVGGLDGDYQRNPIGKILELIPHSDVCTKQTSRCVECNDGTSAPFTRRKIKSDEQILVGGSDIYEPVCRTHYCINTCNL
jgi:thymidine kinase